MTPRPNEYALLCRECDPTWPDSDPTRQEGDPLSTAVHEFPTVTDLELWMDAHQRATGHATYWRTRRLTTRADRVREAGVRYAQTCLECHPEHVPDPFDPVPLALDLDGVTVWETASDALLDAFDHSTTTGHTRFRTEPALAQEQP